MKTENKNILIVTGVSGAGMSSCLKHLEDIGYEVFDNFPLSLLDALIEDTIEEDKPVAVVIDSRSRGFVPEALIEKVKATGAFLLFLTADGAILQRRFAETRRRHPLAKDRPASAGIKIEQDLLHPLQKEADLVIDTSGLSVHDLRRNLQGHFDSGDNKKLTVTLMSFGFKNGTPREADILMDVRFLKNPYWEPELKELTGLDKAVRDYVTGDEGFSVFIGNFKALIEGLLPRYALEGKSYLTIAIGCTGGRHRSVFIAETLQTWITGLGYSGSILHRDIEK